jgi:DNA polymerase-3 subunit delta'
MSFSEVIGQREAKELLRRSLEKQRIASGYLFCGPEGVGKTMTALVYSKAMNCRMHDADSCASTEGSERCPSCKKIDHFSHPDITVIFPVPKKVRDEKGRIAFLAEGKLHAYQSTEVISIDDIRDIEDTLFLKPFEARRRVVIVVDAESMTHQAQNAFLKLLEEPPADTTIILTSSQPERLFPTIRSRCQRIQFKRLSRAEITHYLKERFKLSHSELSLVSSLSNGSISRAHALLDGETRQERELLKDLITGRQFEKLSAVEDREVLERFINFLIPLMRDLETSSGKKILNCDMEEYLGASRGKYTTDEIREKIYYLTNTLRGIARNVNPKLIANVVYNAIEDV